MALGLVTDRRRITIEIEMIDVGAHKRNEAQPSAEHDANERNIAQTGNARASSFCQ